MHLNCTLSTKWHFWRIFSVKMCMSRAVSFHNLSPNIFRMLLIQLQKCQFHNTSFITFHYPASHYKPIRHNRWWHSHQTDGLRWRNSKCCCLPQPPRNTHIFFRCLPSKTSTAHLFSPTHHRTLWVQKMDGDCGVPRSRGMKCAEKAQDHRWDW